MTEDQTDRDEHWCSHVHRGPAMHGAVLVSAKIDAGLVQVRIEKADATAGDGTILRF